MERRSMSTLSKTDVIIVDDNPVIGKLLFKKITPLDLKVKVFQEGQKALDHVQHHPTKLILLDWHMPDCDGIQFLIRLSELKLIDKVEIVMISAGDLNEENEFKLASLGVSEFFTKPIDIQQLLICIRKIFKLTLTES